MKLSFDNTFFVHWVKLEQLRALRGNFEIPITEVPDIHEQRVQVSNYSFRQYGCLNTYFLVDRAPAQVQRATEVLYELIG